MALIWFKADIDSVIDGMTDFEWPCPAPRHLAMIEMQAIIAAGKLDKWSHDRFSRRFKRPVSWCRVLRQAALSQEISRRHADDSQTVRSNDADDKQGRSDNTAISEASVSRSQAGDTQDASSSNASEQHPSCARASSRSKIREETENKTKTETEEKTPQPPKGAVVAGPDSAQVMLLPPPETSTTKPASEATGTATLPRALSILAARPDAKMWGILWNSVKQSSKAVFLEVVDVWDGYRAEFPSRSIIDHKGADKIAAALMLGYSVADLCEVPKGAKLSDFHMGKNDRNKKYLEIETLYRDAKAIDSHIEMARHGPVKQKSGNWRQAGSLGAPDVWAAPIDEKDEVAF